MIQIKSFFLNREMIPHVMMLLLGMIFFIPSIYKIYSYFIFSNKAVSVYGIVDKTPAGGGSGFGGRPLVQYKDVQGRVHVIKSKVKTHFIVAPQKGEKIKVLFLEKNPQTAIVDSIFHRIVLPLIFSVIGACVVFLALRNCWNEMNFTK